MIQVQLKNATLILTPVTEEELKKRFGWGAIYALYKNSQDEIEIGIPDLFEYFPTKANMYGFDEASEKAFFYNGGSDLIESASNINDRPIYVIQPSEDRKVISYDIINGFDIKLEDVLNGNFKIKNDNIEENNQPKQV